MALCLIFQKQMKRFKTEPVAVFTDQVTILISVLKIQNRHTLLKSSYHINFRQSDS